MLRIVPWLAPLVVDDGGEGGEGVGEGAAETVTDVALVMLTVGIPVKPLAETTELMADTRLASPEEVVRVPAAVCALVTYAPGTTAVNVTVMARRVAVDVTLPPAT